MNPASFFFFFFFWKKTCALESNGGSFDCFLDGKDADVSGARVRFVWRVPETLPKLTPSNVIPPFALTKSKQYWVKKIFLFPKDE